MRMCSGNVAPSKGEVSSQESESDSDTELSNQQSSPIPVCPKPPSFRAYAQLNSDDYKDAYKKYEQELERFHKEREKYEADNLLAQINRRENDPVNGPLLMHAPEYFKPRNFKGGLHITRDTHSNRHIITIDAWGRIHIYTRANINSLSKGDVFHEIELGPFTLKIKRTAVHDTWGYEIEIDLIGFNKPVLRSQMDDKDRLKIIMVVEFEGREHENEEVCFHLLNLENPVLLDNVCVALQPFGKSVKITTPF